MKKISAAMIAAILLLATGCNRAKAPSHTMYVSIVPLAEIVQTIVGNDFEVKVMVPKGASPETFEPTPREIMGVEQARLVFNTGLLDYEQAMLSKLRQTRNVVDLSRGIQTVAGCCSHVHHGKSCAHGVDPHIWISPRELLVIAANAYDAIHAEMPDSAKYTAAYESLRTRLTALDSLVAAKCAASPRRSFVIYHPALTYLARDYGLQQIAVEHDGKEPSAKALAELVTTARREGITRIFYQSQFPSSVVETLCHDTAAQPVEIDPLAADNMANIAHITDLITAQ